MFSVSLSEISIFIVVLMWVITLVEKAWWWYTAPHKGQNKQIKNITEKVELQDSRMWLLRQDLDGLTRSVNKIKDNHLVHIQQDLSEAKNDITAIKTDLSWVKKTMEKDSL